NEATNTPAGPAGGNALDQALWLAPAAAGRSASAEAASWQKAGVLPFDHERQLASVLATAPDGQSVLITKGAPEVVLGRCPNVPDAAKLVMAGLFADGARVVAVAARPAAGLRAVTAADE